MGLNYRNVLIGAGSHPCFSTRNLLIFGALRWIQGRHGVYYCGSYSTPGNGHDLSLLSGLVAASAACGAPYPFEETPGAARDFRLLRGLMLGSVLAALALYGLMLAAAFVVYHVLPPML